MTNVAGPYLELVPALAPVGTTNEYAESPSEGLHSGGRNMASRPRPVWGGGWSMRGVTLHPEQIDPGDTTSHKQTVRPRLTLSKRYPIKRGTPPAPKG